MDEQSITGFYGRLTTAAVCVYQQKKLGVDPASESCGYAGPQTKVHLLKHLALLPTAEKDDVPVDTTSIPVQEEKDAIITNANDPLLNEHLFTVGEFKHYQFTEPFTT